MTRADVVLQAITQEIERQRPVLDTMKGLRAVTFSVKLLPVPGPARAIIATIELEAEHR